MERSMMVQVKITNSSVYKSEFWYKTLGISRDMFFSNAVALYIDSLAHTLPHYIKESNEYVKQKMSKVSEIQVVGYKEAVEEKEC